MVREHAGYTATKEEDGQDSGGPYMSEDSLNIQQI